MSDYQEEVLTNLLDLQAELRGDEPKPHQEMAASGSEEPLAAPDASANAPGSPETISVTEEGVTVSMPSRPSTEGMTVNERLAVLHERLARLEHELAGVTRRIERMEPVPEAAVSADGDADADARWRSFLDLQKIVADRLDQR